VDKDASSSAQLADSFHSAARPGAGAVQ